MIASFQESNLWLALRNGRIFCSGLSTGGGR